MLTCHPTRPIGSHTYLLPVRQFPLNGPMLAAEELVSHSLFSRLILNPKPRSPRSLPLDPIWPLSWEKPTPKRYESDICTIRRYCWVKLSVTVNNIPNYCK